MYTRCLFCAGDLGRNEAVEAFPVGRRLAYDAAKGRLWVLCPGCARWNLTPLEERWEAIEQAERLFRGARVRVSSDNMGLVRVADGTDLVRIGRPTLPEFVSWRYADEFARRHRRAALVRGVGTAGVALVAAGLVVGSAAAGVGLYALGWWAMQAAEPEDRLEGSRAHAQRFDDSFVTSVVLTDRPVRITHGSVRQAVVHRAERELAVSFPFGRSTRTLVGDRARRATASMLAYLNVAAAPREFVDRALDRLVAAGSAEAFIEQVAGARSGLRTSAGLSIGIASAQTRLALEIALNEDTERVAMEGALTELNQAWCDAEAIAAIADNLAVPTRIQAAFASLRGHTDSAAG